MKKIGLVLLITGALGYMAFELWRSQGDTLYDCSFRLSSSKDSYAIGEQITLIAEIAPKSARELTLAENLCRSLILMNMEQRNPKQLPLGKPVKHKLTPTEPLRFELTGSVVTNASGEVWIDFRDFGKASVAEEHFPELRYRVLPYKVPLGDSAEWQSSNALKLRLARN